MWIRISLLALLCLAAQWVSLSCSQRKADPLDELGTVRITIKDKPFLLWVADEPEEQTRGLMHVTADRMASLPDGTRRGMIFVFNHEGYRSFWMKNTIIPLDIAYLDSNGKVVSTHTMIPLDDRPGQYPSGAPARFAIEVKADVWSQLGLQAGDRIEIPRSVLKKAP